MITKENAKELYESITQQAVSNIAVLEGGMVGMVFNVKTSSGQNVVFKLYEKATDQKESIDDRIYGSNHSNLVAAHILLVKNNIKTFELLDTGDVEGFTYAIFTLLNGIEPNQEIIEQDAYIEALASVHSITRDYQGWVCNKQSYEKSWKDAFQESIYSRLFDAQDILGGVASQKVKEYIDNHIESLDNPERYVLSHLDGLQAIFQKTNDGWGLSGVIDVEDYQFTDQRFVLAGITLCDRLGRYALPDNFLETYQSKVGLDRSFQEFESLFQVYYLLVWIRVLSEYQNTIEKERCQKALEEIIL